MSIHWANILAGATAAGSLAATAVTAFIAQKARRTAEQATKATVETAKATVDAARAADTSAQVSEVLARIERDRRHDEMFPDCTVDFVWHLHERTNTYSLFAEVRSASRHDYQVSGRTRFHVGGTTERTKYTVLSSSIPVSIHVGDEVSKLADVLELDFEPVEPCPCDRPAVAHWQRLFAIQAPPVPA